MSHSLTFQLQRVREAWWTAPDGRPARTPSDWRETPGLSQRGGPPPHGLNAQTRNLPLFRAAGSFGIRGRNYAAVEVTNPQQPTPTRKYFDGFDLVVGFLPWFAGYVAFVVWARLIVRAIRGEEVVQEWTTDVATALFIAAGALVSAARVRNSVSIHGTVVEARELLRDTKADADRRSESAAVRDDKMYRLTTRMAWVAGLTLAAAVVTLAVAVVRD